MGRRAATARAAAASTRVALDRMKAGDVADHELAGGDPELRARPPARIRVGTEALDVEAVDDRLDPLVRVSAARRIIRGRALRAGDDRAPAGGREPPLERAAWRRSLRPKRGADRRRHDGPPRRPGRGRRGGPPIRRARSRRSPRSGSRRLGAPRSADRTAPGRPGPGSRGGAQRDDLDARRPSSRGPISARVVSETTTVSIRSRLERARPAARAPSRPRRSRARWSPARRAAALHQSGRDLARTRRASPSTMPVKLKRSITRSPRRARRAPRRARGRRAARSMARRERARVARRARAGR